MNKAELTMKIIDYLKEKHSRPDIDEETRLDEIDEDCDFSLMFELCALFKCDDRCDGDEIGEYAAVYNAIDAVWECI